MAIIVNHLYTGKEVALYSGEHGLVSTAIDYIMLKKKMVNQMHEQDQRDKIKKDYNLKEEVSTLTGKPFVECREFNVILKYL